MAQTLYDFESDHLLWFKKNNSFINYMKWAHSLEGKQRFEEPQTLVRVRLCSFFFLNLTLILAKLNNLHNLLSGELIKFLRI